MGVVTKLSRVAVAFHAETGCKYNPFFAVVRGCQVGLVDKNDQFVSKGWKLMTTHSLLAQRMELPCKCPKHVEHVKCEGSVTSGTAFYPQGFATRVCQAIKKGCSREEVRGELQGVTTLLDAFGNGISCLCPEGQRHEANLTCGMCNHQQLGILRGNDNQSCSKGDHQHCDAVEAHPVGEPQKSISQMPRVLGNTPMWLLKLKIWSRFPFPPMRLLGHL